MNHFAAFDTETDPDKLAEAGNVFAILAAYLGHRASMIRYRQAGDTQAAEACKNAAESAYNRLPAKSRWR